MTLVDRQNYHLFQPLAYQVATGGLSAAEIATPLRRILRRQRNVRVVLAEVSSFDLEQRQVHLGQLPNGADGVPLEYDELVVAGGSAYSYFGHEGWAAHAPELKSLEGALELRSRILSAFEAAEVEPDEEKRRGLAHVRRRRRRPDGRRDGRADRRAGTRRPASRLPRHRHARRTRAPRRGRPARAERVSAVALASGRARARTARRDRATRHDGRRRRRRSGDAPARRRHGRRDARTNRGLGGRRHRLPARNRARIGLGRRGRPRRHGSSSSPI